MEQWLHYFAGRCRPSLSNRPVGNRFLHQKGWLHPQVAHDQLRRSAFSIMLNIAEGAGRFMNKEKHNFYVISRSSAFESIASNLHEDTKVFMPEVIGIFAPSFRAGAKSKSVEARLILN